jgi:hypothetical protein
VSVLVRTLNLDLTLILTPEPEKGAENGPASVYAFVDGCLGTVRIGVRVGVRVEIRVGVLIETQILLRRIPP